MKGLESYAKDMDLKDRESGGHLIYVFIFNKSTSSVQNDIKQSENSFRGDSSIPPCS